MALDYLPLIHGFALNKPEYMLVFFPAVLVLYKTTFSGGKSRSRALFFLQRVLLVFLLAFAAADPIEVESTTQVEDLGQIRVLVDGSPSMDLFQHSKSLGESVTAALKARIENRSLSGQVNQQVFSQSNSTRLGDALFDVALDFEGNPGSIIVVSDGQNTRGRNPVDVAQMLGRVNISVYVLTPQKAESDVYIESVDFERQIVSGAETELTVKSSKLGRGVAEYDLLVYVDGVRRHSQVVRHLNTSEITRLSLALEDPGLHSFKVEVKPKSFDAINHNNVYWNMIEVVDKPKILFISQHRNPLQRLYEKLYEVEVRGNLPSDLGGFEAVVLDNQPHHKMQSIKSVLSEHVLEGGGLLVVGGDKAFDRGNYSNTLFETLLPVTSSPQPKKDRKKLAVCFLVDISESTEYGSGYTPKIDLEKALVMRILRDLDKNDSVCVVAFNYKPYEVSPLVPLGPNRDQLMQSVSRLKFGGGTDISQALSLGSAIVGRAADNQKLLILVSDGVTDSGDMKKALNIGSALKREGIVVHTVGVGFDTYTPFMGELAQRSGGLFYFPDETQRLKLEFKQDYSEEAGSQLMIRDKNHYITSVLRISDTEVSDSNLVYAKPASQTLVTTVGGRPIIAVWRFGLGRVAAYTSDNGLNWASEVYEESPRILSRTTNWVVGGLESSKELTVNVRDESYLNGDVELDVKSPCLPEVQALYVEDDFTPQPRITQNAADRYKAVFSAEKLGFLQVKASCDGLTDQAGLATNYPVEYRRLGLNEPLLSVLAAETHGSMYPQTQLNDLVEEVIERAKTIALTQKTEKKHLWHYFVAFTLVFYFLDVCVRRIQLILRLRRS
ncbi:MAG: VWA domain-containing protein [Candidatus Altiarchaeales archaeon]|nr:VWA domain-containing protein [Candidatus Altiarchaeales archaeon]